MSRHTINKNERYQMKLKTGMESLSWMSFNNTRGLPFHGMGAFIGTGKSQRAHVYTAASIPVDPEAYKKIDPKKLAEELEVDMCAVNYGRFWMMDEIKFLVGEMQNFHGMELCWGGDMTGAEMISQMRDAYVPSLIRRSTVWTFKAGKSVFLLREPNGAVWVLQEYTKAVDPGLTPDNLDSLGKKYTTLPQGWKFETKILEKDLVLDTTKSGRMGGHHSRRLALYLPRLRLRQRHQRQLHSVTGKLESGVAHDVEPKRLLHQDLGTALRRGDSHRLRAKPC